MVDEQSVNEANEDELIEEPVDQLPDDLDLSTLELPYFFANNTRRKIPAALYFATAAVFIALWAFADSNALVNVGMLVAGLGLVAFGIYSWIGAWNLTVDEADALAIAGQELGFVIGHASAQLAWRGWTVRPTWRVLVYSPEDQPERRGLVWVDAVKGDVLNVINEANPEDWSKFDL